MIRKKVTFPERVRSIDKSFCFIPHRFLTGGFLQSLTRYELALYLFLDKWAVWDKENNQKLDKIKSP
jgi:hypothetical protein